MLFSKSNGRKKLNQILTLSEAVISEVLPPPEVVSCRNYIIEEEKSILFTGQNERDAAKWPANFDYSVFTYKVLYTVCFRLLTSGRLHLHRGSLLPAGDAVYSLYIHVLQFYEDHGMLGNSCLEEQLDIVDGYIAEVG